MANEIWTDPRTWVDGETPTGSQFNTHLRDNLKYLKQSPALDGDATVTGKVTVGSDLYTGQDLGVARNAHIGNALTVIGQSALQGNVNLGDAAADVVTIIGTVVGAPLKTYTETRVVPVIAGGALTLDCLLGTYFRVVLNANVTVTITNPPAAGRVLGISVVFTADGTVRAITWPPSVVWASGVAPTMTGAANKRDWITLVSDDGGVTWMGCIVGQNY